jgi:hypothetical protein
MELKKVSMKVCIFGLGKSGTTALLFKVAGGLPNCAAFSGGKPGKYVGEYKNAVYKHTYNERKGKNFELFREHFAREQYDRYIWMARDPRDAAISRMLYRWHRGVMGSKKQYQAHVERVLKKEKDPPSVSFAEICRYAGHNDWPMTTEQIIDKESKRYGQMADFVRGVGSDWFLFKYEDMVDREFGALNQYLGFAAQQEEEVPKAYGKVVRKKKYGDWRQWFTEEDVRLFKPAFAPYMEVMGYNIDDWKLDPNPVIEPQYSSEYMQSLPGRVTRGTVLRHIDRLVQMLFKRG